MASTIRHNRARSSYDVDLMSNIIRELHEIVRSDDWITKHLDIDKDEILRLKQITGLTYLFKDIKIGKGWVLEDDNYTEE
ncbi:ParB/RepB/Spo0J family partition protein [Clostridium perfringens]|uniref:IbrB n=1 Tax=Clostridium perfringens B str. ATCC 3626 TaxID=451754 RepID=A0AAV3BV96_CLOPF|nr:IbrB [Clostridium perfringens B str. ATCC 3626]